MLEFNSSSFVTESFGITSVSFSADAPNTIKLHERINILPDAGLATKTT